MNPNLGLLSAKLIALLVAIPLAVVAAYAWVNPLLNLGYSGLTFGVVVATGLSFNFIKREINILAALVGALFLGSAVMVLCLFLMVNVFGE